MNFKLFCSLPTILTLAVGALAAIENTIYVLPNAESPPLGQPGLTPIGHQRAQTCLPALLGPLNIGLIVSCDPDSADDDDVDYCTGAVATVTPTAQALGLTVDTSCGVDEEDDDCVIELIKNFAKTSTKSILVVWDIENLDDVLDDLNVNDDDLEGFWANTNTDVDDEDFTHDLLFTVVKRNITAVVSQACSGIDGQAAGTFRRSLLPRNLVKKRQINSHRLTSRVTRRLH